MACAALQDILLDTVQLFIYDTDPVSVGNGKGHERGEDGLVLVLSPCLLRKYVHTYVRSTEYIANTEYIASTEYIGMYSVWSGSMYAWMNGHEIDHCSYVYAYYIYIQIHEQA